MFFRIAAERRDVLDHPVERGGLVEQAVISRSVVGRFLGQLRVREKSEHAEPVIAGHHDNALLGQSFAVVAEFIARAGRETSAKEPEHHAEFFLAGILRRPHIQIEAVFAIALVAKHHIRIDARLRAARRKLRAIAHAGPVRGRLRFAPAQIAHRRRGKRDAAINADRAVFAQRAVHVAVRRLHHARGHLWKLLHRRLHVLLPALRECRARRDERRRTCECNRKRNHEHPGRKRVHRASCHSSYATHQRIPT